MSRQISRLVNYPTVGLPGRLKTKGALLFTEGKVSPGLIVLNHMCYQCEDTTGKGGSTTLTDALSSLMVISPCMYPHAKA